MMQEVENGREEVKDSLGPFAQQELFSWDRIESQRSRTGGASGFVELPPLDESIARCIAALWREAHEHPMMASKRV